MVGSITIALVEAPMTTHLGPEPSYCVGRTLTSKLLTPSQWATCWDYGMRQPVPGWLTRLGYDFGHEVVPAIAVLAVAFVAGMFLFLARR
jgi:hypothetical protein